MKGGSKDGIGMRYERMGCGRVDGWTQVWIGRMNRGIKGGGQCL